MGCNQSSSAEDPNKPNYSGGTEGQSIGGYQLSKKQIGKGNYSTVHIATKDNVKYACKVVNKKKLAFKCTRAEKLAMEEGLENEINALKVLNHPNIVQLHHVQEGPEILYMVLEYMGGGELFDLIQSQKHLTEQDASSVCRQVASALAYCHSKGVLHRDLKPENLLLQSTGSLDGIKVADFGFAKTLPSGDTTRSILGSPGYLAPEIRLGKNYGAAVDVWSLGVIIYVLIFGYMPFPTENRVLLDENTDINKQFALDYTEPAWNEVSTSAKDLLTRMLKPVARERMTAVECINHPWVRGSRASSQSPVPARNPSFRRVPGGNSRLPSFRGFAGGAGYAAESNPERAAAIERWNQEYKAGGGGAAGKPQPQPRGANVGQMERYASTDDVHVTMGGV